MRFIIVLCVFLFGGEGYATQLHVKPIVEMILNAKKAILDENATSSEVDYIFLTFWDFDGTILKGDCSEGLEQNGTLVYKGLAQILIESGYSKMYNSQKEVGAFFEEYHHLQSLGKWLAYPYMGQIFRGASYQQIQAISQQYFETVLQRYYFSGSFEILKELKSHGIHPYILSASPEMFVKGASATLGLCEECFHGIKQNIKEGRLTEEIQYPITWAEGKTEKLKQIVAYISAQNPDKKVVVLAAFGNSYTTDGPFMRYVKKQALPNGVIPIAVMINGGEPPRDYEDLFMQISQDQLLGVSQE